MIILLLFWLWMREGLFRLVVVVIVIVVVGDDGVVFLISPPFIVHKYKSKRRTGLSRGGVVRDGDVGGLFSHL